MKRLLLIIFVFFLIGVFVEKINLKPKIENETVEVLKSQAVSEKTDTYSHALVKIASTTFDAYVSDNEKLRENGLSGFASLEDNQTMLFIFPNSDSYGFWMKDMLFSIDILWLDEDYKVISFEEDVSPQTFPKAFFPKSPAKYVLEFKAGILAKINIKEGDMVLVHGGK
jgi:uncharacterized protein